MPAEMFSALELEMVPSCFGFSFVLFGIFKLKHEIQSRDTNTFSPLSSQSLSSWTGTLYIMFQ